MGAPTTADKPSEQRHAMYSRRTRGGRHLHYRLEVIQQPERARACGAGPKSSADRRPVDPPPVVELRVYEGERLDGAKDITFTYNANFFLFATLEHARVIAHGRGQAPAANTPPVLTGMPVSGMAYLDRPAEAGYFLFPDLSVRHEGLYKLTFSLYEETKEDRDKDPIPDSPDSFPGGSFDWRMNVKSAEFTVFSAKKFPGLAESTTLSRTVAEQGCRVRIRRDVRMRRRGDRKGNGDFDNGANGEDDAARQRRTQTPDAAKQPGLRSRSMSGSVDGAGYGPESQRRPSGTEYQQAQPSHHPPPPAFPSNRVPPSNHLVFGNGPPSNQPPHAQTGSNHSSPVPRSPSHPLSHGGYPQAYPPHPQSTAYAGRRSLTPAHSDHSQNFAAHVSPKRESFPSESRRLSGIPIAPHPSGHPPTPSHSNFPALPQEKIEPASAYRPILPASPLPSISKMLPYDRDSKASLAAFPSPDSDQGYGNSIEARHQYQHIAPAPAGTSRKRHHGEANLGYSYPPIMPKDGRRPEQPTEHMQPFESTHLPLPRADGRVDSVHFLIWPELRPYIPKHSRYPDDPYGRPQ